YLRDPATLARPWVRPGTPGLEHRIGGIEKQDVTGNISYDPENHDHMVRTRAEKVRRVAQEIPPTTINGPATGDLLVVGWGGTYGAARAAPRRRKHPSTRRRTSSPTRTSGGARAAGTTRSSPRCRRRCRTSASRRRTSSSSRGSAARAGFRTT